MRVCCRAPSDSVRGVRPTFARAVQVCCLFRFARKTSVLSYDSYCAMQACCCVARSFSQAVSAHVRACNAGMTSHVSRAACMCSHGSRATQVCCRTFAHLVWRCPSTFAHALQECCLPLRAQCKYVARRRACTVGVLPHVAFACRCLGWRLAIRPGVAQQAQACSAGLLSHVRSFSQSIMGPKHCAQCKFVSPACRAIQVCFLTIRAQYRYVLCAQSKYVVSCFARNTGMLSHDSRTAQVC